MRLIDADAINTKTFVDFVGNQGYISFGDALWMISELPTIEAVPVVHGYDRWNEHKEHCEFWCSVCGYWLREIHEGDAKDNTFNFCPNCGADMRKKV